MVPQFLDAISKLDWPKAKLDVMFLLEADDVETIEAFGEMNLPYYARTVVVPHSMPKTKPKACNYGLSYAKGEYLVIYDAEDVPDPSQLKKAYLGFRKAPKNVGCLQAKLNFYNANHNLLTRLFTAEYSLWFDITLIGLHSLKSSIPLGGTSNHFRTKTLHELEGWDPFNVTEDADLGIRLFYKGYQTAIIDSTTLEEATSKPNIWLKQRSRWLKGYMQTYLVHMRNMGKFTKEKGIVHNMIFQMTVGGKILFILLNPLMWIITLLYFAAKPIFGPALEAIFVAPVLYLAVISWIFGNFLFIYYYMIGVGKRQQWDITKYVFLIPIYWVMMSTAAMIGFWQLIFKPHYWEKTVHGFHLGTPKPKAALGSLIPEANPVYVPVEANPAYAESFGEAKPAYVRADFDEVKPAYVPAKPAYVPAYASVFEAKYGAVAGLVGVAGGKAAIVRKVSGANRFIPSLLRGLPVAAFLLLDVILASLFLAPDEAQIFLMTAIIGKMIILASQLLAYGFAKRKFTRLLFFSFLFNWIGFVVFGIEGSTAIPAILGNSFQAVIPYVPFYLFGFLSFAGAALLSSHNLKSGKYTFALASLLVTSLEIPFMMMNYRSVGDFVRFLAYLGSVDLILLILLQANAHTVRVLENIATSFFGLLGKPEGAKAWKEKRMHILIFNWRDTKHVYAGGAEVYVHQLGKRWVQDGNKVTMFCGNDYRNRQDEKIDGVQIIRRGGTYTVYLFAFLYYLLKLRGKYDVIIDCENGIPFFTPFFTRRPVVLLIHHVHQEVFRTFLKFPFNLIAQFLEGKLMPLVYKNKMVITVSESSRKEISQLGFTNFENISIIPNGVSESLYGDQPKTSYPSFVYLGRLKKYKNIDVAVDAFAALLKSHKDARFSIVGSGELYPELVKQVKELGIEHAVTFHGRVSETQKARLLAESWAAVQPSQIEGWGITVIEANATGTPVIASRVSGLCDSVIDDVTGMLVTPGSVSEFAWAMRKIVRDEDLRLRLSLDALRWSKHFNWDKSARDFYSLIGRNFGQEAYKPVYGEAFTK